MERRPAARLEAAATRFLRARIPVSLLLAGQLLALVSRAARRGGPDDQAGLAPLDDHAPEADRSLE